MSAPRTLYYPPARVEAAERLREGDRVRQRAEQPICGSASHSYSRVGVVQGINYDYSVRVLWEADAYSDTPYYQLAHAECLEAAEVTP